MTATPLPAATEKIDLGDIVAAVRPRIGAMLKAASMIAALLETARREMGDEEWQRWLQAMFPDDTPLLVNLCNEARAQWGRAAAEKFSELQ